MKIGDQCEMKRCKGVLILAKGMITGEAYIRCNRCNYSEPIKK